MKIIIMTLNTILLFSILSLFTSCNGQGTSKVDNRIIAKGDTVKEPGNSAWYIFQSKNNNYWFGSDGQGVYRYDGKNTIHFTTKDGLCNDRIRGIQEDKSGNIYFNTVEGRISKFDGKTFSTLIAIKSNEWKLEPNDLWFQGAQNSGVVYRYDGKSLHRLEFPKTKAGDEEISRFPRSKFPNAKYSPYDVYSIYKDRKGNIWFGTGSLGVCRYDGKSFSWISEDELGYGDLAYGVRSTIEDKDGRFWFSNVMHRYNIYQDDPAVPDKSSIPFKKEKGIGNPRDINKDSAKDGLTYFLSSTVDSTGALWMVTYSAGVWRYDGKNLTHYSVKDGDKTITLFSIYKDNLGDLWLGTHESGPYKFNGKTFERFRL